VEKYDLLVAVLDEQSILLDTSKQDFFNLKQYHAHDNATFVLIYLRNKANRIISGQIIDDIEMLPCFDDTDGKLDAIQNIYNWIYEAQSNMQSGNVVKLRTGIFVDVLENILDKHSITPVGVLGNLEETYYYTKNSVTELFELVDVSMIERLDALASKGDEKAMYELGVAFATGKGIEIDLPKAQMLLYKSYLRGHVDSIFTLVDLIDEPTEHIVKEAEKHGYIRK
jgi:hypothetical protein